MNVFFLIKGTFHVKGYSPDGDSIRFQANDSANWKKLSGPAVELNAREHAQLRMEAVDALETHYEGYHQPLKQAKAAGRFLLSSLGINEVVWDEPQRTSNQSGRRNGGLHPGPYYREQPPSCGLRLLPGRPSRKMGKRSCWTQSMLKESLNYKLIARGLAYPTYYNGLFSDLRNAFTDAMIKAKEENKGLWPYDRTTQRILRIGPWDPYR